MTTHSTEELITYLIENTECDPEEAKRVVTVAISMNEDGVWKEFYDSELSPSLLSTVIEDLPEQGSLEYRWNWCAGLRGSYEHLNGYRI
jgi:hypothetical protein